MRVLRGISTSMAYLSTVNWSSFQLFTYQCKLIWEKLNLSKTLYEVSIAVASMFVSLKHWNSYPFPINSWYCPKDWQIVLLCQHHWKMPSLHMSSLLLLSPATIKTTHQVTPWEWRMNESLTPGMVSFVIMNLPCKVWKSPRICLNWTSL